MKSSLLQVALLAMLPLLVWGYTTFNPTTTVRVNGRHVVNGPSGSYYQVDWPGSSFTTLVTGTPKLYVDLFDNGNQFSIFVNNYYAGVLITNNATTHYLLNVPLNPTLNTSISLYRRTEASFGISTLVGFSVDDINAVHTKLYIPTPDLARKMEYWGDSITCGYGNLGTPPCPFNADTEDNYEFVSLISTSEDLLDHQVCPPHSL